MDKQLSGSTVNQLEILTILPTPGCDELSTITCVLVHKYLQDPVGGCSTSRRRPRIRVTINRPSDDVESSDVAVSREKLFMASVLELIGRLMWAQPLERSAIVATMS